ncbi:hypothetical protein D623_10002495 [Myotis brandtii]|uniref:Uncharacterized protein n=1 Tax=Myotis brandtii TaxID=109478 RepID=S7PAR3_MYOBR|nr:hypothetical protein D623_10002495 [Myotis brandtii]
MREWAGVEQKGWELSMTPHTTARTRRSDYINRNTLVEELYARTNKRSWGRTAWNLTGTLAVKAGAVGNPI